MTGGSHRQLIFEIQRVQTIRRKVATSSLFCGQCSGLADFAALEELAFTFEVSVAEAVLQLRERGVHMQHQTDGHIVVCTNSLLDRSTDSDPILTKSLPPAGEVHLTFPSE